VHVHVPFVIGTDQEVSARWHHEGLNALPAASPADASCSSGSVHASRTPLHTSAPIRRARHPALRRAAARGEVAERLSEGRDWLLEWNSRRSGDLDPIIDGLRRLDDDPALEAFMLSVFDLHFVDVEDVAPRTWRLASAGTFTDLFPGLTSDGVVITCDRQRALARETSNSSPGTIRW
jgi:ATP-dependent helicase HepA